ncbi:Asp23/Gls24 family envelope stress response protein [Sphaerisporangium corydalis]|uniref:Asp23/Gls24 family envelope stress response protein n=1 Tax=Sphaerisporangium corydalis TaxID=1441875 RepID=A0ABV9EB54_9ACTN|nr:Asp23/Gls24 family envelope stress response protein [Sphaerisporangium corydalis]
MNRPAGPRRTGAPAADPTGRPPDVQNPAGGRPESTRKPSGARKASQPARPPEGRGTAEAAGLADRIAQAVAGCRDVASLGGSQVATYLSGRTVSGVAVRDTEVEVAVAVRYGRPLAEIAEDVRTAVGKLAPGLPVHVRIVDIDEPGARTGAADRPGDPPVPK